MRPQSFLFNEYSRDDIQGVALARRWYLLAQKPFGERPAIIDDFVTCGTLTYHYAIFDFVRERRRLLDVIA